MEVIALGSDHAAFQLKENIKEYLAGLGYQVRDFGTTGPDSVDYPDYGIAVGEAVSHGE